MADGGASLYIALALTATAAAAGTAGAYMQYKGAKAQEKQLELEQDTARARSRENIAQIKEQQAAQLAAQRSALATRGIDVGGTGTVDVLSGAVREAGRTDLIYERAAFAGYSSANRMERSAARVAGTAAIINGVGSVAGAGASAYSSYSRIGTVPGQGSGSGTTGARADYMYSSSPTRRT